MLKIVIFTVFLVSFTWAKSTGDSQPSEVKAKAWKDPCSQLKCKHGQECVLDHEKNTAQCRCVKHCQENKDPRRLVCSNHNSTWESDCHLHQHRCNCLTGLSKCSENDNHIHIDYYGACKAIAECDENTLTDFPRRMREWLFTIMSRKYSGQVSSEPSSHHHSWINAVIWKFCDLDKQPSDRFISRHELFPLRAPLFSMEPCISKFLDTCDPNDDHKITLVEWGKCLGADDDEMSDKCDQFRKISE